MIQSINAFSKGFWKGRAMGLEIKVAFRQKSSRDRPFPRKPGQHRRKPSIAAGTWALRLIE